MESVLHWACKSEKENEVLVEILLPKFIKWDLLYCLLNKRVSALSKSAKLSKLMKLEESAKPSKVMKLWGSARRELIKCKKADYLGSLCEIFCKGQFGTDYCGLKCHQLLNFQILHCLVNPIQCYHRANMTPLILFLRTIEQNIAYGCHTELARFNLIICTQLLTLVCRLYTLIEKLVCIQQVHYWWHILTITGAFVGQNK